MKILITGGAGFIGSNLVDHFLASGHSVICLDNFSTGYRHNINMHIKNPNFLLIEGDIRDLETCRNAIQGCDYVSHQAALGSVPRSISDPATTNDVNISGFLNMLIAARDENIQRFVYAASSSTYGDSKKLPKVEEEIGKPLSPYAITKYVNELYAEVFAKTYGMQCIGLRYFNVFGKRQDPNGGYAAVIPCWTRQLLNYESPVINGDGSYSRDFTYIENVLHANEIALFTPSTKLIEGQRKYYNLELDEHKYMIQTEKNPSLNVNNDFSIASHFSEVFNIAFGDNTTLTQLFESLKLNLATHDVEIDLISPTYGPARAGDVPHSQASILKAKTIIGYNPSHSLEQGLEEVAEWYYRSIR